MSDICDSNQSSPCLPIHRIPGDHSMKKMPTQSLWQPSFLAITMGTLFALPGPTFAGAKPNFGPNVYILDPSMPAAQMQLDPLTVKLNGNGEILHIVNDAGTPATVNARRTVW